MSPENREGSFTITDEEARDTEVVLSVFRYTVMSQGESSLIFTFGVSNRYLLQRELKELEWEKAIPEKDLPDYMDPEKTKDQIVADLVQQYLDDLRHHRLTPSLSQHLLFHLAKQKALQQLFDQATST